MIGSRRYCARVPNLEALDCDDQRVADMPANKNHHYVPQFYLRNFAVAGERCVRSYNISRRHHTPRASVAGQCHRPYLYGHEDDLEKALGEFERDCAPIVRALIDRRARTLDQATVRKLYRFVMLQFGRTPSAADETNNFMTSMMRAVMRTHPSPPAGMLDSLDDVRMVHPRAVELSMINAYKAAPVIYDLSFCILENRTVNKFITSDVPVILHNQWNQDIGDWGVLGFACHGLQVFLPLSPEMALVLFDDAVYDVRMTGHYIRVNDDRLIRQLNVLEAVEAESDIYYRDEQTAAQIDSLPWNLRRPREHGVKSIRLAQEDGNSRVVMTHRRISPVKLTSSLFAIRTPFRHMSREERARSWRPFAQRMVDAIGPRASRPSVPEGTRYVRIPDNA